MSGYWLGANLVLGVHMALLAGLAIGVVPAALGILHRFSRLALIY